jgi:hypothetical protein
MFSPAIVNVLCFDPNHGADQARGYAGKYCAKPEASHPAASHCLCLVFATHVFRAFGVLCIGLKQCRSELFLDAGYFMESEKNGIKSWLKARTQKCYQLDALSYAHPINIEPNPY